MLLDIKKYQFCVRNELGVPKLKFEFVHLLGAKGGKCVHPEFKSTAKKTTTIYTKY